MSKLTHWRDGNTDDFYRESDTKSLQQVIDKVEGIDTKMNRIIYNMKTINIEPVLGLLSKGLMEKIVSELHDKLIELDVDSDEHASLWCSLVYMKSSLSEKFAPENYCHKCAILIPEGKDGQCEICGRKRGYQQWG